MAKRSTLSPNLDIPEAVCGLSKVEYAIWYSLPIEMPTLKSVAIAKHLAAGLISHAIPSCIAAYQDNGKLKPDTRRWDTEGDLI